MLTTVFDEGDGISRIEVTDPGSRYQLVSDKLMRDDLGALQIKAYMVSLDVRDASLRASWFVRRDRWTWAFQILWKAMAVLEEAEARLLCHLYRLRRIDDEFLFPNWRRLVKHG